MTQINHQPSIEHMAYQTAHGGPPVELSNPYILHSIMRRCTICPECGEKTSWMGHRNGTTGTYQIKIRGRTHSVRRIVLELNGVALRPGSKVITRCDNHRCLNLDLLAEVDMGHIVAQAIAAGTLHTRAAHAKIAAAKRASCGVISQEQAREIRVSDGPSAEVAARYGITESYVRAIRTGRARKEYQASPFTGLGAR